MRTAERLLLIGQPILFALAVIAAEYTAVPTTIGGLVRPTLVVVAFAGMCLILAKVLTRSWALGALLSSALVLFTLREYVPALVIFAGLVSWPLLIGLRRIRRLPAPRSQIPRAMAGAAGIFSAVLLLVMGLGAVHAAVIGRPQMSIPHYVASGSGGPNIYVLLVDGYPRADTLQERFGIDNRPFTSALEEMGFSVANEARTNYNKTWLTLASALNGAYIEELIGDQSLPSDAPSELRWLQALIAEAGVPKFLRDQGYAIRTIPPPYTSAVLTTADEVLDGGHLTEFEVKLIVSSPLTTIFRDQVAPFLYGGQAQGVIDGIDSTVRLAESRSQEPQFVLSHIHSPHPPFVLRPSSSEPAPIPGCFPRCSLWESRIENLGVSFEEYQDGLSLQIEALNGLLLRAIARITDADPNAVIILLSDHGTRYSPGDVAEHYRSFLAARTPGYESLFPRDESPVNIFRRLMAAYFGVDAEPLPYRAWGLDWAYNLRLTELPAE